ncbi:ty3-gypsy retrotransposon protein [Cucumis melo var. makuwa]|uniref:Ty3-gypsy retrotransposon protein n=1 Tax=Cucumis melo var. makuwa TaxID=1194695 RepID=A0A5A7SS41_CUCMM|nr:ty3-gypsy retrotransposon protein [Cucumis melo var. makuwa]TYK16805.1 ty3-gypsy retrotransposon protein [Cucumis melo var. makuwa]
MELFLQKLDSLWDKIIMGRYGCHSTAKFCLGECTQEHIQRLSSIMLRPGWVLIEHLPDRPPFVIQYSRRKTSGMARAQGDGSGGSGNHLSGDHSYLHGGKTFESVKFITMAQKRIEEKLITVHQEISGIRAELHESTTIKEDISSLAKSIERLGVQAEKQQQQQQTLLKYIEGMTKGKTTMEEKWNVPSVGLAQMMKLAQKIENQEFPMTISQEVLFQWTITLRGVAGEINRREGPSRWLSDAEFQARHEKGLYFGCEEKFYAGHRCRVKDQKELRVLIVQADGEELEVEEEDDYTEEPELKLPLEETSHYGVILGSGNAVKGKGICSQVEITLGDWKIVDNFLPLELGGVDVILGMQWLHTLGVTEVDWRKLTLTFIQNEKKVVIRGDPSLTKTRVSLKHMMKTWIHLQKEEMERLRLMRC